jgi:hypothetical protein
MLSSQRCSCQFPFKSLGDRVALHRFRDLIYAGTVRFEYFQYWPIHQKAVILDHLGGNVEYSLGNGKWSSFLL